MSDTTASVDHLNSATRQAQSRELTDIPGFGCSPVLRGLSFCAGCAFFVASVALWAFTSPDAAVMLVKLGASIFFLGGACIFLLVAIAPHDFYRLELDPRAQELRVFERDECGRFYLERSERLSNISRVRFEGGAFRAWSKSGEPLFAVPMRGREARDTIRAVMALN